MPSCTNVPAAKAIQTTHVVSAQPTKPASQQVWKKLLGDAFRQELARVCRCNKGVCIRDFRCRRSSQIRKKPAKHEFLCGANPWCGTSLNNTACHSHALGNASVLRCSSHSSHSSQSAPRGKNCILLYPTNGDDKRFAQSVFALLDKRLLPRLRLHQPNRFPHRLRSVCNCCCSDSCFPPSSQLLRQQNVGWIEHRFAIPANPILLNPRQ